MFIRRNTFHRPKVVVVMGPTSCGKTRLSIDLMNSFNRGLDITTNTTALPDRNNVSHHLLGDIGSSATTSSASINGGSIPIRKFQDLGYLPKSNYDYGESDRRKIQSAMERFQVNHSLEATGVLDFQTETAIKERRCSWPDIVDGVNLTRIHCSSSNVPSSFTFLSGEPKWGKRNLSFLFEDSVPKKAKRSFRLAFAEWARCTDFTFSETYVRGDIVIGFYKEKHGGDCPAFNGPGGAVAHSFSPCDGRLHVDKKQYWSYLRRKRKYFVDLVSVALHELGHVLGLNHSSDKEAVMYAVIYPNQVKNKLTNDDIQGIKSLYNQLPCSSSKGVSPVLHPWLN